MEPKDCYNNIICPTCNKLFVRSEVLAYLNLEAGDKRGLACIDCIEEAKHSDATYNEEMDIVDEMEAVLNHGGEI